MPKLAPYFSLPTHRAEGRPNFLDECQANETVQLYSRRAEKTQAEQKSADVNEPFAAGLSDDAIWQKTRGQFVIWLPQVDKRLKRVINRTQKQSALWLFLSTLVHIALLYIVANGSFGLSTIDFLEKSIGPIYMLSIGGLAYSQSLSRKTKRLALRRKKLSFDDFILEVILGNKIC